MSNSPPLDHLATKREIAEVKGEIGRLDGEIGKLDGVVIGEIGKLQGKLDAEIANLRSDMHRTTLISVGLILAGIALAVAILGFMLN